MDVHRQAINNSIFLNEQDIGKAAVSYLTINYNKKHGGKTNSISLQEESISCVYMTVNRALYLYLY